jgi:hypothetical protein
MDREGLHGRPCFVYMLKEIGENQKETLFEESVQSKADRGSATGIAY